MLIAWIWNKLRGQCLGEFLKEFPGKINRAAQSRGDPPPECEALLVTQI